MSENTTTNHNAHLEMGGAQIHISTMPGQIWVDGQARVHFYLKDGPGIICGQKFASWEMLPDEALRLAEALTATAIRVRDHGDEINKEFDEQEAERDRERNEKLAELARVLAEVDEAARKFGDDRSDVLQWLADDHFVELLQAAAST